MYMFKLAHAMVCSVCGVSYSSRLLIDVSIPMLLLSLCLCLSPLPYARVVSATGHDNQTQTGQAMHTRDAGERAWQPQARHSHECQTHAATHDTDCSRREYTM